MLGLARSSLEAHQSSGTPSWLGNAFTWGASQSMTSAPEKSLNKKETAGVLAISLRHLNNLLQARAIEYMKIGRSVRITPEALQRFKESHSVKPMI